MEFLEFKSDATLLLKILHGFHSAIKTTSMLRKLIHMVLAYLSNLIVTGNTCALQKWHLPIISMPLQCCPLCLPKTLFLPLVPNYLSPQVLVWTLLPTGSHL